MDRQLKVYLYASDLLTETGLRAQIQACRSVTIEKCPSESEVAILATPGFDDRLRRLVERLNDAGCGRIVVVTKTIDVDDLPLFFEMHVSGLLRESDASPRRLATAAKAVAGGGAYLPPDLTQHLLTLVNEPELLRRTTRRSALYRLDDREEAVIRLLAEGYDTYQIAEELHFSERTIKGVVHRVIKRFGLRNRSHAVAFALRRGLI